MLRISCLLLEGKKGAHPKAHQAAKVPAPKLVLKQATAASSLPHVAQRNQSDNGPQKGDNSAPKKNGSGFNFVRAVQGPSKSKNQQKNGPISGLNQPQMEVSNRFSILDFEASVKANNLVWTPMDQQKNGPISGLNNLVWSKLVWDFI